MVHLKDIYGVDKKMKMSLTTLLCQVGLNIEQQTKIILRASSGSSGMVANAFNTKHGMNIIPLGA